MYKRLLFTLFFLLITHHLLAQAVLTGTTSYTQNFDGLASSGTGSWADNSTIPGWYAAITNASNVTSAPTTYLVDPGSSATGGLHSYGATSNPERALGSVGSGSAKTIYYGVLLTNNTGSLIKALSINYKGEQWRSSTSVQNTLGFSYKVGATSISESGYTNASLVDFVGAAPVASNGQLDGNTGVITINNTISVNIPAGQSIMLRWMDIDDTGSDAGLAIDDLTVSVVSTPFLTASPISLGGLVYPVGGGPSTAASFTLTGGLLTPVNPITINPPANFEVSANGSTYTAGSLPLTPAADGSINQTIYTRLIAGLSAGPYSGNITVSSADILGSQSIALSGIVYPAGATGPCGISTNINTIRAAADGITFTATGRVTSNIGTNIYIQDATGGILLYTGTGTTVEIPDISIGDEVQVTGVLATYQTDRELKNFTTCFKKTTTPNVTPAPTTVSIATFCDHKGELVTIPGLSIVNPSGTTLSGNTTYTVSDGTQSAQLRIQNGTNLVNANRPAGTADITGVVSIFNGVCQLLPRSTADLPGSTANTAACPDVGTGGAAISTDNTLDIVWWNVEWLGNTGYGPTNEAQQQSNVAQQLQAMSQDIYCLEEVTDLSKLDAIITTLNANTGKTYAKNCGTDPTRTPPIYYSHWWDDPEVISNPSTYAQRVCFVYNTAVVSNVSASQILAVPSSLSTSAWASNRFPLLMSCTATINGISKSLKLVGLHAKSGSDNSSYSRRIGDFTSLKTYLDNTYPTDNVLIMGDYNDDADQSIYVDATTSTTNVSSFSNFITSADYTVITKQLSACNISSTASYPDIIDHLTVSNEISTNGSIPASGISYIPNSVKSIRPIIGGTTTSDHFPVTARFQFSSPNPVKLLSFTGQSKENTIVLNWATAWEEKNEGFDILKGKSATGLEKVGFVAGHATTTGQSVYDYLDADVQANELYYYQLRQRDIGGGSELSNIIAVRALPTTDKTAPIVYPNPSNGAFTLSLKDAQNTTVKLYNLLGVEMPISTWSKTVSLDTISISPKGALPAGIYYLQTQSTNGTDKKLIKIAVF